MVPKPQSPISLFLAVSELLAILKRTTMGMIQLRRKSSSSRRPHA